MKINIQPFHNSQEYFNECVTEAMDSYRNHDASMWLYRYILNYKNNKISEDFIDVVYAALDSWNMNQRGARLSDYDVFVESIMAHEADFRDLGRCNNVIEAESILKTLFERLELVDTGKPRLVTFSKTLHFFFPSLIYIVDRTYTLMFLYGNMDINAKSTEAQFRKFMDAEKNCYAIDQKYSKKALKSKRKVFMLYGLVIMMALLMKKIMSFTK